MSYPMSPFPSRTASGCRTLFPPLPAGRPNVFSKSYLSHVGHVTRACYPFALIGSLTEPLLDSSLHATAWCLVRSFGHFYFSELDP